ncbi:MAG: C39 family peptidase [Planctomycetota bacterium]|nr:C39 family peptidase [Planctomycetota bacterium]
MGTTTLRRRKSKTSSSKLELTILPQPDLSTCGPTCLHALYAYHGDKIPLPQVVREVRQFEEGGTLAVLLGLHALQRGYKATLYTYNLKVFDPTWFKAGGQDLAARLEAQLKVKRGRKFQIASEAYIEFLRRGGRVGFADLSPSLIRSFLHRGIPVLTGLSATYLYRTAREVDAACAYDDLRGEPAGHFVVLCGYDAEHRHVRVADPLLPNPMTGREHHYDVPIERLICSILLGILTYDANLLILEPLRREAGA